MRNFYEYLALTESELSGTDPVIMNLLVAQSLPNLAELDIAHYATTADEWAAAVRERLSEAEQHFHKTPWEWKNDVNFFRLGVLCGFLEYEAGIAYNGEQQSNGPIWYTNPTDLFLNGVMDTRRGTCANMAVLHVAIGRRLGWPVSLACVRSHFICRYDDGEVKYNIEATQAGHGGFKSDPDDYLIQKYALPRVAISSGSDLRALQPREMLGVFIGFRGRHLRDTGRQREAESDYLLARSLFPASRTLYLDTMALTALAGARLFEPGEVGSPETLAELARECRSWSGPSARLLHEQTI